MGTSPRAWLAFLTVRQPHTKAQWAAGCWVLALLGNQGRMWEVKFFKPSAGAARQCPSKASKLPPIAGVAFMSGARLEEGPSRWWAAGTPQWEWSP